MTARLTAAFTAGLFAVVNPCGFAMLPAYLSYFLGIEDRSADARASVWRAIRVSLAVSSGFVVVFGVIGVALEVFSLTIEPYLPYVVAVMGLALMVLGVAMLRGFQPSVSLPHLDKGGRTRELRSMALFGVSYAIASLSCTLPVFLLNVVNAFSAEGPAQGLAIYLAFALGMASVLTALTVTMALARQGLLRSLRSSLPYITRASGGFLVLVGAFLAYWGWYERQVYGGNYDPAGPGEAIQDLNGEIVQWMDSTGPLRIGAILLTFVAVIVALVTWRSHRTRQHGEDGATEPPAPADAEGSTTARR